MTDRVRVRLDGITERLAKITPGPWHIEESRWEIPGSEEVDRIVCGPTPSSGPPRDGIADVFDGHWVDDEEEPGPAPNLHFIAAAPSDVAALAGAVEALLALADHWAGWPEYRHACNEIRRIVSAHLDAKETER